MSRWLVAVSQKLEPLYQRMHDLLVQQPVLWADETTLKVIQSEKSKSYMWVYGCGGDKPPPASTSPPTQTSCFTTIKMVAAEYTRKTS